jgi:hypothetical protein
VKVPSVKSSVPRSLMSPVMAVGPVPVRALDRATKSPVVCSTCRWSRATIVGRPAASSGRDHRTEFERSSEPLGTINLLSASAKGSSGGGMRQHDPSRP